MDLFPPDRETGAGSMGGRRSAGQQRRAPGAQYRTPGDVVAEVPDQPEFRAVHGTGKDAAALSVALSVAVSPGRVAPDVPRGGPPEGTMDDFISHFRGCATFPMIPSDSAEYSGNHDTCSVDGLFGFGKTQNLDLTDQLNAEYDLSTSDLHTGQMLRRRSERLLRLPRTAPFRHYLLVSQTKIVSTARWADLPLPQSLKISEDRTNWVIRSSSFEHAKDLYLTFTSAVSLKAHSYAKTINPRLNDYLAGSLPGHVGIIAMDYFEEPRELVSDVVKMNSTTGTTVGHDVGASAMVDVSVDDRAASSTGSGPGRG
jgi:hypothetical protein